MTNQTQSNWGKWLLPVVIAALIFPNFTLLLAGELELLNSSFPYGPVRDGMDDFQMHFGWPKFMAGEISQANRSITVFDFDSNNDNEVAILTTENRLHVFQHDGANFPGFPLALFNGNRPSSWINPSHQATTASGDVTGNLRQELVYITDIGYLHVIDEEGQPPFPFPIDLGRDIRAGIPALVDIDPQRGMEIVFNTWYSHPDSSLVNATMHIIRSNGEELHGWPVRYPRGSISSPAVGDIDNDGLYDIVVGNRRHLDQPAQIWAWSQDASRIEGFPTGNFETINGSPTLADLTGDGAHEIVFWAAELDGEFAGIYIYQGDGRILDGFPVECMNGHPQGSPVVADITGDGSPEIVFGANNVNQRGEVFAFSASGELLEGFPVEAPTIIIGSAILADVSGDGISDIIVATAQMGNAGGTILAWSGDGQVIDGFPLRLDRWGGGVFAASPTVYDVNRDGYSDILALTTSRRLMVWTTEGRYSRDTWHTEKGGFTRLGVRPKDDPTSVKENDSSNPITHSVITAYPNPFNAFINVTINNLANTQIELIDVNGRQILKTNHSGNKLTFNTTELGLSAGIYFLKYNTGRISGAIKLVYQP